MATVALAMQLPANGSLSPEQRARAMQALEPSGWRKLFGAMDPAALALAKRHDPYLRKADAWGRPEGWTNLDLREAPAIAEAPQVTGETAQEINSLLPFSDLPIRPMRPFVLNTATADGARALDCLSKAVYYEAAREPRVGQEAVAQVVLNRVRHPAYPKSVCGVVFQGSARATGCQFTFTCDGSLRYAPEAALWRRAQDVAGRALAGYVETRVGSATHYHAQYVSPYWAPTLVKMTQVGQHIFYRWTGPWGEPPAFSGRYAGNEAYLSRAVLGSYDPRTQGGALSPEAQAMPAERKVTIAVAGDVRTYTVADATAPGGARTRVAGTIVAPRRQASVDDVKAINARLADFEKGLDQPVSSPAASGAAKDAVADGADH